jgi:flagellar motor protein MotB
MQLSQMEIPLSWLTAIGYGDAKPVADNGSEEGRRRNRRVEIVVFPDE